MMFLPPGRDSLLLSHDCVSVPSSTPRAAAAALITARTDLGERPPRELMAGMSQRPPSMYWCVGPEGSSMCPEHAMETHDGKNHACPMGSLGRVRTRGFQPKDLKCQLFGEFFIIKYLFGFSLQSNCQGAVGQNLVCILKILRIRASLHVA